MSQNKPSYARILKTTTLLGGSSVLCVILGIVRTKVLAVELGPALFGVMGLYMSLLSMVASVTTLGLGQSAVRDIAAAAHDEVALARTVRSFRLIVWFSALLGAVALAVVAQPASLWTFGNAEHAAPVALLSLVLLLSQLNTGQLALLQGLQRIGEITAANVGGAILGTAIAVPIIFALKGRGIVPFMLSVAAGQLAASWWYARRVQVQRVSMSLRTTWREGREMLSMGLVFVISGVSLAASTYLIRLCILRELGDTAVGLYQAALTISSIYVGFILQGMAGDYYPRLSANCDDPVTRNRLVSEQAEMAVLVAVPGLIASLILAEVLIALLYSGDFVQASGVLRWHVLGLLGRLISWPMGFILLARRDKGAFLAAEISTACMHVCCVFVGIRWCGIAGAGAAFAVMYLFNVMLVYALVSRRHNYAWPEGHRLMVVGAIVAVGLAFGSTAIASPCVRWLVGGAILAMALAMSLRGLAIRLGSEQMQRAKAALLGRVAVRPRMGSRL